MLLKNGIRKSKEIVINDNKIDIIDSVNIKKEGEITQKVNLRRLEKGGVKQSG